MGNHVSANDDFD